MSITEITSLITAIGAAIGVIVAALWGRVAVKAKDTSLQAKDTLLDNLKISQEEVIKTKEIQITNLKEAQQEVITAKNTHIQSLNEKIDFLNKFNPDAIKTYYLSTIAQISDIANTKENRIKELDAEIQKLNFHVTDLNGKISLQYTDNEILQRRLDEADQNISMFKDKNHILKEELELILQEFRKLKNVKADLLEDERHYKKKIEQLQSDFNKAKEEISVLRNRGFKIEHEKQQLSDQNTILLKQADELRASKNNKAHELIFGSKICPMCQSRNNEDAKFCANCGNVFEEKAA